MKVDMNLLPEEQRPRRWALPLTVGLILAILAIGYYGFGFYQKSAAASSEVEQLQSQLDQANEAVAAALAASEVPEYERLVAEAQAELEKLGEMEKDYEIRNAERVYWKPVLQTVRELVPTDIILTSFEQNGNELVIEGETSVDVQNTIVIVEYAQRLEKRGIFARSPALEIGTEQREIDGKTVDVFIFTILLEVKLGG